MVRAGDWPGGKGTGLVVWAGTVTFCVTVIAAPWPGGLIVAATSPRWGAPPSLLTSVFTVSADRLRLAVLCCTTRELPAASASATDSWTGNWRPVLLSGGI